MHQLLKPVVAATGRPFSTMLAGKIALVLIVCTGLLYLILYKKDTAKTIETAATHVAVGDAGLSPAKDSSLSLPIIEKRIYKAVLPTKQVAVSAEYFSEIDSIIANMKINFTPCESCPVKPADSLAVDAQNKLILEQFLDELQSPVQEFVINSNDDTSLVCSNGTVIVVSAASFADKGGTLVKRGYQNRSKRVL